MTREQAFRLIEFDSFNDDINHGVIIYNTCFSALMFKYIFPHIETVARYP